MGKILRYAIILSPSLSILVFLPDTDLRCYLAREWYLVGTDGANAKRKNFPGWMLFRNCLRILKLTNREGDYWSNMDTGGIKGMHFIRNLENHAELEKLNDQLEAIGHHIQLIKEEARAEKENTKEMVSDISHQLKTPVAALDTCFSVLMQNDLSATEQEEFRIRCRSALDGLETLLQSLLEISKMETGLIQINKKKLSLMDTVISAVNRTYPKADEKEIEFVFDYEKELETCTIMQDKRWLGEAVINVLDNAVKYSPCGSKIFIRLQKRNYLVRMEIEDQGIGIPQNEYHKIFQRFYRGSSKEVVEKSGTGIGLFLSREIIEKHAGTITVTSGKKKKGSTFVIQLPYVG